METNLSGKTVVICGAARGIGRAIAVAFAEEGCEVVALDRSLDEQDRDTARIRYVEGDVSSADDVARLNSSLPSIDHVVFAVGIGSGVAGFPFWNLEVTDWNRVLEVNLLGAVNVAHRFAPRLAQQRCGSLTFLVSVAGQIGSPTDPPYSASKAALINFMQVAARDLAPFGVRANAISPGMVQTDLNRSVWQASQSKLAPESRKSYQQWADEKIQRICPLARWQTSEQIAATSVFLASDHAMNITGQTLNVDGGQVMHA